LKSKLLIAVNILLLVGLAGFGGYYFKQYREASAKLASPEQAAQAEVERYVSEVGKLYALPADEQPSVATVKDKEKLQDQPFFANAENGDVTLIYSEAKLAILYRPSTKQLINVSSVTIQNTVPTVKVVGTAGARASIEKTLTEELKEQFTLIDRGEAKGTHEGVVVVDLNGQQGEAAQKLAEELGGRVGQLPEGEEKPAGIDLLVIAGS
jgi:hypothetical protein